MTAADGGDVSGAIFSGADDFSGADEQPISAHEDAGTQEQAEPEQFDDVSGMDVSGAEVSGAEVPRDEVPGADEISGAELSGGMDISGAEESAGAPPIASETDQDDMVKVDSQKDMKKDQKDEI